MHATVRARGFVHVLQPRACTHVLHTRIKVGLLAKGARGRGVTEGPLIASLTLGHGMESRAMNASADGCALPVPPTPTPRALW